MSKLTHESLRQMISEEISKLEASKSEPKSVKVTAKQLRGIILQEVNSLNEQDSGNADADSAYNLVSLIVNNGRGPEDKQEVLDFADGLIDLGWHGRVQLAAFAALKNKHAAKPDMILSHLLSALLGGKDSQSIAIQALLSPEEKAQIASLVKHTTIKWA